MPNIEESIRKWRQQMLAAGIQMPVPLEELEIHLREEIERLARSGVAEDEAFHSAVQRIGSANALRNEFENAVITSKGRRWKWFENFFLLTSLGMPLLVGALAFFVQNGGFSEMTSGQQVSSLGAAVAFSLLAWGTRYSCGRFPVLRTRQIRDALFVSVLLWLLTLAYLIMPHCDLATSQRAVASLWGFAPFGILMGWCWGFARAEREKTAIARS